MTVKELMAKGAIRNRLSDSMETGYDDDELIAYVNDAINFIWHVLIDNDYYEVIGDVTFNETGDTVPEDFYRITNQAPIIVRGNQVEVYGDKPQKVRYFKRPKFVSKMDDEFWAFKVSYGGGYSGGGYSGGGYTEPAPQPQPQPQPKPKPEPTPQPTEFTLDRWGTTPYHSSGKHIQDPSNESRYATSFHSSGKHIQDPSAMVAAPAPSPTPTPQPSAPSVDRWGTTSYHSSGRHIQDPYNESRYATPFHSSGRHIQDPTGHEYGYGGWAEDIMKPRYSYK